MFAHDSTAADRLDHDLDALIQNQHVGIEEFDPSFAATFFYLRGLDRTEAPRQAFAQSLRQRLQAQAATAATTKTPSSRWSRAAFGPVAGGARQSRPRRWWPVAEFMTLSLIVALLIGTFFAGAQILPVLLGQNVAQPTGGNKLSATFAAQWSEETLWRVDANLASDSDPLLADGVLYAASQDGAMLALDAETGDERWRVALSEAWQAPRLTIVDDVIIVGGGGIEGGDGSVYAVSAEGQLLWDRTLGDRGGQPCSDESQVFASAWSFPVPLGTPAPSGEGLTSVVAAFDSRTGVENWQKVVPRGFARMCDAEAGVVYWASDNTVFALDGVSGKQQWQFETGSQIVRVRAANGLILAATISGVLIALEPRTGNDLWRTRTGFPAGQIIENTIVAAEPGPSLGHVGPTQDIVIVGIDVATGDVRWRERIASLEMIQVRFFEDLAPGWSIVVEEESIYVSGIGGALIALDFTTREERWVFDIGGEVESTPIITDGIIYVVIDGAVVAIDEAAAAA